MLNVPIGEKTRVKFQTAHRHGLIVGDRITYNLLGVDVTLQVYNVTDDYVDCVVSQAHATEAAVQQLLRAEGYG